LPLVAGWGGGSYSARAVARIGRLLLREGDWDGKRVLGKEAVRQITGDAGLPGHCGMGFWTNAGGRYPKLPRDTYYGAGAGDQLLIVVPSLQLIVVRNGETLAPEPKGARDVFEAFHDARVKVLFEPIIDAIADRPRPSGAAPYPRSKAITGITWAPKATIVRKARGSDNWPLTWADDDCQYTAYGDGWGFEPFLGKKRGLGFARIKGGPASFAGENVLSPTGEQFGNGPRSKKASGILCVEEVLYLWARNAGNAQLAWSKDHGKTWAWAPWKLTTSFGCPTFLNFGKNYAGARDEWVYVYSHDAESAYRPADRMVLARVPKSKITQRAAYEFFRGLDKKQQPLWSKEIADRAAVFTHKGRCYRSGITFNAGLKRYLWVQIIPGTEGKKADTRFEGGFAVYDAPEPWGPWTTVYFTEKWDVGPGESASFPTKWMSGDGKTVHLVFSGDDHFAVRQARLTASAGAVERPSLGPEALQAGDIPGREAVVLGGTNDPVDVVVAGWSGLANRGDVAERRPPLAVQRFDQDGLGQVGPHPILRVQAAKLLVRARGHDAVNAVLVGADQGSEGLDVDVEAVQLGHFVPLGNVAGLLQHVQVQERPVEEGPHGRLGHRSRPFSALSRRFSPWPSQRECSRCPRAADRTAPPWPVKGQEFRLTGRGSALTLNP
jgi:hypothetical protein